MSRLASCHINCQGNGKTGLLTSSPIGHEGRTYKSNQRCLILTRLSTGCKIYKPGDGWNEVRKENRKTQRPVLIVDYVFSKKLGDFLFIEIMESK